MFTQNLKESSCCNSGAMGLSAVLWGTRGNANNSETANISVSAWDSVAQWPPSLNNESFSRALWKCVTTQTKSLPKQRQLLFGSTTLTPSMQAANLPQQVEQGPVCHCSPECWGCFRGRCLPPLGKLQIQGCLLGFGHFYCTRFQDQLTVLTFAWFVYRNKHECNGAA